MKKQRKEICFGSSRGAAKLASSYKKESPEHSCEYSGTWFRLEDRRLTSLRRAASALLQLVAASPECPPPCLKSSWPACP